MAGPRERRSAVASSLDNLRRVRGLGGLDLVVVLMMALDVFVTGMEDNTEEDRVKEICGNRVRGKEGECQQPWRQRASLEPMYI